MKRRKRLATQTGFSSPALMSTFRVSQEWMCWDPTHQSSVRFLGPRHTLRSLPRCTRPVEVPRCRQSLPRLPSPVLASATYSTSASSRRTPRRRIRQQSTLDRISRSQASISLSCTFCPRKEPSCRQKMRAREYQASICFSLPEMKYSA